MKHIETLIIGAGISGLSCARKLADSSRDFLVITDRLGGRMHHSTWDSSSSSSKSSTLNLGATYVNDDYTNILKYVDRGQPFKLSKAYCENEGKLTTAFNWRNWNEMVPFVRLVYRVYQLRFAAKEFRKDTETTPQIEVLSKHPIINKYVHQAAEEFIQELNLQTLNERYCNPAFQATCFVNAKEANTLFYLGNLFPLIIKTYIADFTHTYSRLTKGYENKIVIDKVCGLQRNVNGNWNISTISGENYTANNVVIATPYHNASEFYPVPKPKLSTSATVLYVKGQRKKSYRQKDFMLFHPERTGIALLWGQTNGLDLIFSVTDTPELEAIYKEYDVIEKVHWKTAVVISDENWVPLILEPGLFLVGDYNVCGLEDTFITGLCAANHIIAQSV